jgi:hypothetical protein
MKAREAVRATPLPADRCPVRGSPIMALNEQSASVLGETIVIKLSGVRIGIPWNESRISIRHSL